MVVAADDVRDPVEPVLDRRGEVVGRAAVRAQEDEVLELLVRDLDATEDGVVEARHALVGHPEADRALVLVGAAGLEEALRLRLAELEPVELERDRAVPVEAEPAERVLDLVGRLGDLAARVGVLDPQPELAALVAREEPVEERRPDVADAARTPVGKLGGHARTRVMPVS